MGLNDASIAEGPNRQDKETNMPKINHFICTHSDMDGFCSGAILLNKFPDSKVFFTTSNSLHKTLYRIRHSLKGNDDGFEEKNQLVICDISLNSKFAHQINNALRYIRVDKKLHLDLTWIDHHQWPPEVKLLGDFEQIVDPTKKAAAIMVQERYGTDETVIFSDLAEGISSFEAISYWKNVIRNASKSRISDELLEPVLKAFSKLEPDVHSDAFNIIIEGLTEQEMEGVHTHGTDQGRRFAVLDLRKIPHKINLYKEVFKVARYHDCHFVCVVFENGELSCYNTDAVSFGFLKDHGAVGHLEKGAVHVPIPYTAMGVHGFQRPITLEEFIDLLKLKL